MSSITLNARLIQYEKEPPVSVPQKPLHEMVKGAKSSLSSGERDLRTRGELQERTQKRIERTIDTLAQFDIDLGFEALAAYNHLELMEKVQKLTQLHPATQFWPY